MQSGAMTVFSMTSSFAGEGALYTNCRTITFDMPNDSEPELGRVPERIKVVNGSEFTSKALDKLGVG